MGETVTEEERLLLAATGRLESFVVSLLHKLNRTDLDTCLRFAHDSSDACHDSYATGIVASLLGGWGMREHVEKLVKARHADIIERLEVTDRKLREAESVNYELRSAAQSMRDLADRLDPPKKPE